MRCVLLMTLSHFISLARNSDSSQYFFAGLLTGKVDEV